MTSEQPQRLAGTRPDRHAPARIAAAGIFALFALVGCADFSRGSAAPDGSRDAAAETVPPDGGDAKLSFGADIHGLLITGCARCHAVGGQASDTQLLLTGAAAADLAVLTPFIDSGAPASSRLLAKTSGQGHGGGVVYAVGTPEYATVLRWIEQGASP